MFHSNISCNGLFNSTKIRLDYRITISNNILSILYFIVGTLGTYGWLWFYLNRQWWTVVHTRAVRRWVKSIDFSIFVFVIIYFKMSKVKISNTSRVKSYTSEQYDEKVFFSDGNIILFCNISGVKNDLQFYMLKQLNTFLWCWMTRPTTKDSSTFTYCNKN